VRNLVTVCKILSCIRCSHRCSWGAGKFAATGRVNWQQTIRHLLAGACHWAVTSPRTHAAGTWMARVSAVERKGIPRVKFEVLTALNGNAVFRCVLRSCKVLEIRHSPGLRKFYKSPEVPYRGHTNIRRHRNKLSYYSIYCFLTFHTRQIIFRHSITFTLYVHISLWRFRSQTRDTVVKIPPFVLL
jgi:hypothetical protein